MKKLLMMVVFVCISTHAQFLVEDNDITENVKENAHIATNFDLQKPLEFYRLKCKEAVYAKFPGGEAAFKIRLSKILTEFFEDQIYAVNGTFDFEFSINKYGELQKFTLKPEVSNSALLYKDLNSEMSGIHEKWTPASCEGSPIDSKLRLRINFRSESFDL